MSVHWSITQSALNAGGNVISWQLYKIKSWNFLLIFLSLWSIINYKTSMAIRLLLAEFWLFYILTFSSIFWSKFMLIRILKLNLISVDERISDIWLIFHISLYIFIKCVTFLYVSSLFCHNSVKNAYKTYLFRPKVLK